MTTDEVVEFILGLDGPVWRQLATQMMWYHNGYKPLPHEFAAAEDIVSDKEQWREIKRLISRRKRSAYRSSKRRKQLHKLDRRRTYMRHYMRNYRSR